MAKRIYLGEMVFLDDEFETLEQYRDWLEYQSGETVSWRETVTYCLGQWLERHSLEWTESDE